MNCTLFRKMSEEGTWKNQKQQFYALNIEPHETRVNSYFHKKKCFSYPYRIFVILLSMDVVIWCMKHDCCKHIFAFRWILHKENLFSVVWQECVTCSNLKLCQTTGIIMCLSSLIFGKLQSWKSILGHFVKKLN